MLYHVCIDGEVIICYDCAASAKMKYNEFIALGYKNVTIELY